MRVRDPLTSPGDLVAKLNLLGDSPAFMHLLRQIDRFARCDATILLDGETGTGKELAARAIHYCSARREGPFIPVNCGSIPDSLIGSELFGHVRGAFTDAREAHPGLVAQADGGSLFLDELETLTPRGQVALLRFLQDREYRPLGTTSARTADVRVIGATNANLDRLSQQGEFRRDLLYRVSVLVVEVPPLRSRADDAIVLARAFLQNFNARYGGAVRTLHEDALALLRSHDWPGNVRELENLIHREFLLTDDAQLRLRTFRCTDTDLAGAVANGNAGVAAASSPGTVRRALTELGFREAKAYAVAEFERAYVMELLARTQGNVSLAARLAGKERSRLARLVRKYHLSAQQFRGSPPPPPAG